MSVFDIYRKKGSSTVNRSIVNNPLVLMHLWSIILVLFWEKKIKILK